MSLTALERSALSALLALRADNAAVYAALTAAKGVRDINEIAGLGADPRYRLIRVDHRLGTAERNEFEIALVDDIELSVAYYDKVTLVRAPKVSTRYLASNLAWRSASSRHSLALRDISQKILFSYLVHHYDILLAANKMADGGVFYWPRQVSRALKKGLHVYTYEPTTQAIQSIPTQRALDDLQDQVWSGTSQEDLQAIISIAALVLR